MKAVNKYKYICMKIYNKNMLINCYFGAHCINIYLNYYFFFVNPRIICIVTQLLLYFCHSALFSISLDNDITFSIKAIRL